MVTDTHTQREMSVQVIILLKTQCSLNFKQVAKSHINCFNIFPHIVFLMEQIDTFAENT